MSALKFMGFPNNQVIEVADKVSDLESELILIDSRMRDWNKFEPNSFSIELGQRYKDVTSIELVEARIQLSGYNITNGNNKFIYIENENEIHIELTEGIYDIGALTSILSHEMSKHSHHNYKYVCSYNKITKKIKIKETHDHDFEIIFTKEDELIGEGGFSDGIVVNKDTKKREIKRVQTGNYRNKYIDDSIGQMLGFLPTNLKDHSEYTSQGIYNLLPDDYITLFINTENHEDFDNIMSPSPLNNIDGAFALIDIKCHGDKSFFTNYTSQDHYVKYFNPPIQFSRITVEYRTLSGKLYNFYGLNNSILLDIKKMFTKQKINKLGGSDRIIQSNPLAF